MRAEGECIGGLTLLPPQLSKPTLKTEKTNPTLSERGRLSRWERVYNEVRACRLQVLRDQ